MIIDACGIPHLSSTKIEVLYEGKLQGNIITLNTVTGEAVVCKRLNGELMVYGENFVTENITFDISKLEIKIKVG